MGIDAIYMELRKLSTHETAFFGRKLITVKRRDFEPYKRFFNLTENLLNSKPNFRTRERFKHIHAIEIGEFVQFHFDYGNPCEYAIMAIPHLFLDVIPYFLWHLIILKKPYQIEVE